MNTYAIEWHEEGLKNRILSLEAKKNQLAELQANIERSEKEIAFTRKQIERAKELGKTSFDPERFLKKERV